MVIVALHDLHGNADSLVLTVAASFSPLKLDFFCQREFSLENFILTHHVCSWSPHLQTYFCVYRYIFFNRGTRAVGYWGEGALYDSHILERKSSTEELEWTFKLAEKYLETFHSHFFSKLLGKRNTESRGWKIYLWNCSSTSKWGKQSLEAKALTVHRDGLCIEEYNSQLQGSVSGVGSYNKKTHMSLDAVKEAAFQGGNRQDWLQRGKQKMDLGAPEPQSCLEREEQRAWSSWAKMQNEIQDSAVSARTQDPLKCLLRDCPTSPLPHLREVHSQQLMVFQRMAASVVSVHPQYHWGASSFSVVSRPHWSLWMANHAGRVAGGVEDGELKQQGSCVPTILIYLCSTS